MGAAPKPQPAGGPPPGHPAAPPPEVGRTDRVPLASSLVPTQPPAPAPELAAAVAAGVARAKAEVEARYVMALQRPRDVALSTKRLLDACDRVGFADEAMYARPAGKKKVQKGNAEVWEDAFAEGLSIRFAEEAARSWGNLMVESAVTHEDAEQRVLRITVTDLEVNLTYPFEVVVPKTVERRTLKRGQRAISARVNSSGETVHLVEATDDDVLMKANALASKAMRTGVLRLIPADVQEECKRRIQATLTKAARESGAIAKLVGAFEGIGVSEEHLVGYLGHAVDHVTAQEYASLRGVFQAIRDGEATWEDVIRETPQTVVSQRRNVRTSGYEAEPARPVASEVIHMADKPDPRGKGAHLGPDVYSGEGRQTAEADLADDQRIADAEGGQ